MSGNVLIVDPVLTQRIMMKVKLSSAHYATKLARSVEEAVEVAATFRPDVVIASCELPDGTLRDLRAQLHRTLPQGEMAMIVMVPRRASPDLAATLRDPNTTIVPQDIPEEELLARLRSLLRKRARHDGLHLLSSHHRRMEPLVLAERAGEFRPKPRGPKVIYLVTLVEKTALLWKSALARSTPMDIRVRHADTLLGSASTGQTADAFIIETQGAGDAGMTLMTEVKSRQSMNHAPTLIVATDQPRALVPLALDMGADDACDGFDGDDIAARVNGLLQSRAREEKRRIGLQAELAAAITDPLTGVHNRRHGLSQLSVMLSDAMEHARGLSLFILDIDHFKSINDSFGHAAGDDVLVEFSRRIRQNLRSCDLLARIGGDEFAIALAGVRPGDAGSIGEQICHSISQAAFDVLDRSKSLRVSVSVGISGVDCPSHGDQSVNVPALGRALLAEADHALYMAKAQGRNRVSRFKPAA